MKTKYYPIRCKKCFEVFSYFPYRAKNLALVLLQNSEICKKCYEVLKKK